jgi:hypothetical protein
MAIKEFHEWIKTKKNFKENNGENSQPKFKSSILAARFPKFKIELDKISNLSPEDVTAIINELIPAIQQAGHKSASATQNIVKQALNPGRNEPTVGGAPEVK